MCKITKKKLMLIITTFSFIQGIQSQEFETRIANAIEIFSRNLLCEMMSTFYKYHPNQTYVFFSPHMIINSLMSLELGTGGTSRSEIRKTLGFFQDSIQRIELYRSFAELLKFIDEKDGEIEIINLIFVPQEAIVKRQFLLQYEPYYRGILKKLPFSSEPHMGIRVINGFVKIKSNDTIEKIYSEPLKPDTQIVVVPSLTFNARWYYEFNESDTRDEIFNTDSGQITVQMMTNKIYVVYLDDEEMKAEIIKLAYSGTGHLLTIILPHVNQTLERILKSFEDFETFRRIETTSRVRPLHIKIPRFKLKWCGDINEHLQDLGIKHIFSDNANMSNMIKNMPSKVSKFSHPVHFDIHEKGSGIETPVVVSPDYFNFREELIKFYVNRPFLFYLRNIAAESVLLFGWVKNPNDDNCV